MKKAFSQVDAEVGSRLRWLRQSVRMTQSALAEAIGLTFQQVQKYETGINRMGASRLQQIADVFNVPPSYFFDGNAAEKLTNPNDQDSLSIFLASAEGSALARSFATIEDKALRRLIVRLVEKLTAGPGGSDLS